MDIPHTQLSYNDRTTSGSPAAMPTSGPGMPVANPFTHSVPQPQQNGYPIPSHDYYSPLYQPSHLANTPTYQTYNGPTYSINNGHLAAPQMGPDPQTTASTYDVSRPGTAYSGMSGTAVASQQSHATGDGYRRSRGESDTLQACDNPSKPPPATGPPPEAPVAGCHCIIM